MIEKLVGKTWGEMLDILRAANAPYGESKIVGFHESLYLNADVVEAFIKEIELAGITREPLSAGQRIAFCLLLQKAGL